MWNKAEAIDSLTVFYGTIERPVEDPTTTTKTWRRLWMGKDKEMETVFYAQDKLDVAVDYLLQNKSIDGSFTRSGLLALVAERLGVDFISSANSPRENVETLVSELVNKKPELMNVYMAIHGLVVQQRTSIGEFEFIPAKAYSSLGVKCFHPQMETSIKEQMWQNQDHVMVSVTACEPVKAREKAYAEFQWLESAARLFVDSDFYDIGITSFNYSHVENSLVTSEDGQMRGTSATLKGSPVPLPFARVFAPGNCLCRVVDRLGRQERDLSQLQQKIRHAVYLGGLSVRETTPGVAYFLCVSAMEALFQADTSKYVSPSIAQQIIEAFCYLIADEAKRRDVFEQMRSFYGKRSAFAHGGKSEVTVEDVQLVRAYLRAAILKMIDDPILSKLRSSEDVATRVRDIKFGEKEAVK